MLDMVKYTDCKGQAVEFTAQDVKARLCPNIGDNELALVMGLCQAQNLNPFTRDVYIIKYGNAPASIVTGKEVFTKRAQANPRFKGYKAGIVYMNARGEVCKREGGAVYARAKEILLGGWCEVYVDGAQPFYDEVVLEEYQTTKTDPKTGAQVPSGGWAKMPATMARKVALVHCLREAFPSDFQGLYIAEEMGKAGEQAERMEQEPQEAPQAAQAVEVEPLATDEQVQELRGLVAALADCKGATDEAVISGLEHSRVAQSAGVETLADMTEAQARVVINQARAWLEQAQAARAEKESELAAAIAEAEEVEIPF